MPSRAKLYILTTIFAGWIVLAFSLLVDWSFPQPARFSAYLMLACAAALLKVKLPTIQGTISVIFVFVLLGIAQMNLTETLLVGCLATALQCVWKPKKSPTALQVCFNVAVLALSVSSAYWIPRLFTEDADQLAAIVSSACIFFAVNTGLVAAVLALLEAKSIVKTWRECHLWTFPYYLAGAMVAGAASACNRSAGWQVSLLILPVLLLFREYYKTVLELRSENPLKSRAHAA